MRGGVRRKHGMRVRRIGADDEHHVGVLHRIEILRARGRAVGLLQAVTGG